MENQLNIEEMQRPLPNGTAVLVLGILSIIGCFCYGIGVILGPIALILARKDSKLYHSNPAGFILGSWKNLKAGRVCAIIGTILSVIFVVYLVFIISYIGWDVLTSGDPEAIVEALEDLQ